MKDYSELSDCNNSPSDEEILDLANDFSGMTYEDLDVVAFARDLLAKYRAPAAQQDASTGQPVAYVIGYHDGRCVIEPTDRATVLPAGMALYRQRDASAAQALSDAAAIGEDMNQLAVLLHTCMVRKPDRARILDRVASLIFKHTAPLDAAAIRNAALSEVAGIAEQAVMDASLSYDAEKDPYFEGKMDAAEAILAAVCALKTDQQEQKK